jgi:hypothetical protein
MDLTGNGFGVWTGLMWLGQGPVAGSCDHDNEYSSSIKQGSATILITTGHTGYSPIN